MSAKSISFTKKEKALLVELLEMHIDNFGHACETDNEYNSEVKFVNKIYEKLTGEKDAFGLAED